MSSLFRSCHGSAVRTIVPRELLGARVVIMSETKIAFAMALRERRKTSERDRLRTNRMSMVAFAVLVIAIVAIVALIMMFV
jgi:uncharacterized membrane protein YidH (DUF202 family)